MVNHRGKLKNQHQILTNMARMETAITIPMRGSIGIFMKVGTRVHPLKRGKACRGSIGSTQVRSIEVIWAAEPTIINPTAHLMKVSF